LNKTTTTTTTTTNIQRSSLRYDIGVTNRPTNRQQQ